MTVDVREPERTTDALVGRLFEASIGMFDVMSVYVGDRLGLYRALHDGGPATTAELAARAGIDERYAREWLEQQAVDRHPRRRRRRRRPPSDRRYTLPEAYAAPLLDPDSPLVDRARWPARSWPAPRPCRTLLDAFRTGGGVDWTAYGPDMIEAQGDFNRPWLRGSFGTEILPAIPAVHDRLAARSAGSRRRRRLRRRLGGDRDRRAPTRRSASTASTSIASSIELARANAREAGVADRVTFAVRDAADPAAAGQYDLVVVIEAIHDLTQPVEVLARDPDDAPAGRHRADRRREDRGRVHRAGRRARADVLRLQHLHLPAGGDDRAPTAGTGTVIRADTMRAYAEAAGFRGFERLDEPSLDVLRLYVLKP